MLSHIELLEKRIKDYSKKNEELLLKIKMQLKKGDKQSARITMIKKKKYEKFMENFQNSQNILEQQIFDLKNAENNVSVTEILKNSLSVGKEIGVNPDEFAEVTQDLKDQKDALEEMNSGMKEYTNEKDEEELNEEMEKLMIEEEKKVELPNANKEKIDENKIFEDLVK